MSELLEDLQLLYLRCKILLERAHQESYTLDKLVIAHEVAEAEVILDVLKHLEGILGDNIPK